MNKLYYFYMDEGSEGGTFGHSILSIRSKKIKKTKNGLDNYLFGRLSISSIRHIIYLFKHTYPMCPICFDSYSEIKYTKEQMTDYHLNLGM